VPPVEFALPELEAAPLTTLSQLAGPLEAARAEADMIRMQAQREGYEAGLAEAQAQLAPAVAALGEATAGLGALQDELVAETEEAAVGLALRIAEQVLAGALEVQPERVVDAVRGALRRLVERDRVTILVNPDDLEIIRSAVPGLESELGGITSCDVQAERRVSRGGAVVRTGEGEVDATIETKLLRAREVVAGAVAG
jgi:flagellar assembly protein FliH